MATAGDAMMPGTAGGEAPGPPGRQAGGHLYAVMDGGYVLQSGQSMGTAVGPPPAGEQLERARLDRSAASVEDLRFAGRRVIWWNYRAPGESHFRSTMLGPPA